MIRRFAYRNRGTGGVSTGKFVTSSWLVAVLALAGPALQGCGSSRPDREVVPSASSELARPASGSGIDGWLDAVNPQVRTAYGVLRGNVDAERRVVSWRGVPYARPPVGELRWRAPQEPARWGGVRDALESAPSCVQAQTTITWVRTGVATGQEDCLYLDIYRPARPTFHGEKLPVYVWIHGGSNNFGSAANYDGSELARRSDAVFVAVQYRLGPMGWFFHPDVQTRGADALSDSGNFGTLDHVRALSWIRDNIAAFGGDSGNVTITGESAGGHNVVNLIVSPLAAGLFHRAMGESAAMLTNTPAAARSLANKTIEYVIRRKEGVDATTAAARRIAMENAGTLYAYLRDTPAGDFFLAYLTYGGGSLPSYGANEDGSVLPVGGWMPALRAGIYNRVPTILGANQYEAKAFAPAYGSAVKAGYGQPSGPYSWANLHDVLKGTLKSDGNPLTLNDVLPTATDRTVYELGGYYGGRLWRAKFVDSLVHEMANHQADVYAYQFNWGGPQSGPEPFAFIFAAGHSSDIPFFLGTTGIPGWGGNGLFGYASYTPENAGGRLELQSAMMAYLAQFARTGDPNGPLTCSAGGCLPPWQPWSNQDGAKAIVFDATSSHADITIGHEELTVPAVKGARDSAIAAASLSPGQAGAVRLMSMGNDVPWP